MKQALRTVLVGFGAVAVNAGSDPKMAKYYPHASHAQVLRDHPDFDWQAVVDPDPEAQKKARREWGVPHVVSAIEELPENFMPEVAVIATPPNLRLDLLRSLVGLKGAIIEKPVGQSLKQGRQLLAYCEGHNIVANVNLFRRADPTSQSFQAGRLKSEIGDIQAGIVLYGNGLRNNGLHMIDLLRMLGNEIIAVQAVSELQKHDGIKSDADGDVSLVLTLKNGAPIMVSPLDFSFYRDVLIDIWGTKGRLEIFQEGLYFRISGIRDNRAVEGEREISIDHGKVAQSECGSSYYNIYSNLARAIAGKEAVCSPISEAIKSEEIIEAAFKSLNLNGKKIFLSEL